MSDVLQAFTLEPNLEIRFLNPTPLQVPREQEKDAPIEATAGAEH